MTNANTELIWGHFSRALRRFLVAKVGCEQDADDLLQEIFIKIHLKLHTLNKEDSLTSWVWQVTRNTLLDYKKKRRINTDAMDGENHLVFEADSVEINHLLADCIGLYLELLPANQREALQLADLENVSQKALAERWGVSYSGAKSRVQRARVDLYNLFQQCCQIKADAYGNIIFVECWEK